MTGIDISAESIDVARAHARTQGLPIDYQNGSAAQLPFDGSSFEVVSCCDVLEHIPDWEAVIAEVSRVLTPGGLFLFDTINRTQESKVNFIFGLQDFAFTKLFPKDTHVWKMFITPDELTSAVEAHSMEIQGFVAVRLPQTRSPRCGKYAATSAARAAWPNSVAGWNSSYPIICL